MRHSSAFQWSRLSGHAGIERTGDLRPVGALFPDSGIPERTAWESIDERAGVDPQARAASALNGTVSFHHLGETGGTLVRCVAEGAQSTRRYSIPSRCATRFSCVG